MTKTVPSKSLLSAGQRKLESLGVSLPLFPTTSVGSLPKHSDLVDLKYRVSKGFQQLSELERKEKIAIEYWIHEQEKIGLDILVDGEINRSDFLTHFASKIEGFSPGGLVRVYGNRYYRKPIIKKKLEWKGPLISETWRLYQRMTHKPLKAVLTGPYTLLDWSFNEFYGNRATALFDLAKIIHKELVELEAVGAKIIQIDEPAMSSRPQEFNLVAEGLKIATQGIKSYLILHHSYGDLTPIWARMQHLPVDNFDLETTNSRFSILPLVKKIPTHKDLTIGIIESHKHNLETPKEIQDRIRQTLRVVPAKQLWFSPDCGLKTRKADEATKKLSLLNNSVLKLRNKFKK